MKVSGPSLMHASSSAEATVNLLLSASCPESDKDDSFVWEAPQPRRSRARTSSSSRSFASFPNLSPFKTEFNSQWYEMNDNSRFSEGDESIADFSIPGVPSTSRTIFPPDQSSFLAGGGGGAGGGLAAGAATGLPECSRPRTSFLGAFMNSSCNSKSTMGVGNVSGKCFFLHILNLQKY